MWSARCSPFVHEEGGWSWPFSFRRASLFSPFFFIFPATLGPCVVFVLFPLWIWRPPMIAVVSLLLGLGFCGFWWARLQFSLHYFFLVQLLPQVYGIHSFNFCSAASWMTPLWTGCPCAPCYFASLFPNGIKNASKLTLNDVFQFFRRGHFRCLFRASRCCSLFFLSFVCVCTCVV